MSTWKHQKNPANQILITIVVDQGKYPPKLKDAGSVSLNTKMQSDTMSVKKKMNINLLKV